MWSHYNTPQNIDYITSHMTMFVIIYGIGKYMIM